MSRGRAEELPATCPGAVGYRWPAEWEPHAATWLSWPHNRETWPGRLEAVERAFAEMVRALWLREDVCINVSGAAMEDAIRSRLHELGVDSDRGIHFFEIATDDAWVRDHGPIFLTRSPLSRAVVAPTEQVADPGGGGEELALVDFGFNAWGGK